MLGCIFYDARSTLHSPPQKLADPWMDTRENAPQGWCIHGAILEYKQKNK